MKLVWKSSKVELAPTTDKLQIHLILLLTQIQQVDQQLKQHFQHDVDDKASI